MGLRGIGRTGAWTLVMEFFGWRDFHNRREVASAAGLTGTPYDSGDSEHEQGISKAAGDPVPGEPVPGGTPSHFVVSIGPGHVPGRSS
jgi:hypothetical protein